MARTSNEHYEGGVVKDPDGRLIVVGPDGVAISGGGGGGTGQIQVKDSGGVSTNVGHAVGNQTVPVDDNGGSLTVDGTVTVANPTTNPETGLAKDATLTNGTQRIESGGATGAAVPARALQVGGSDGTNLRAIKTSATGVVSVDGSAVTQPVSGTFWQATQPVSGTVTANVGTTNGLALDATLTGGTAKAIARGGAKGATAAADLTGTAEGADHQALDVQIYHGGTAKDPTAIRALTSADVVTAAQGTAANLNATVVQPTASNLNAAVIGPTLTKGTQGATGFSVQDLKDSGRTSISITGYQVAGIITTEALFAASLVRAADGTAAAAAAQHTVTAGKRLRIQNVTVTVKNTAAAAGTSKLALRYRPAGGTVAITDSIIGILDIGSNNATAANYIGPYVMPIPDGFELIAGATFGFTNLSSAVTMLHTITLLGFEY